MQIPLLNNSDEQPSTMSVNAKFSSSMDFKFMICALFAFNHVRNWLLVVSILQHFELFVNQFILNSCSVEQQPLQTQVKYFYVSTYNKIIIHIIYNNFLTWM